MVKNTGICNHLRILTYYRFRELMAGRIKIFHTNIKDRDKSLTVMSAGNVMEGLPLSPLRIGWHLSKAMGLVR